MASLLRLRFRTASNFGYFIIDGDFLRIYWWCGKLLCHTITCITGQLRYQYLRQTAKNRKVY